MGECYVVFCANQKWEKEAEEEERFLGFANWIGSCVCVCVCDWMYIGLGHEG